jgi:putative FmdB family regulatory protein
MPTYQYKCEECGIAFERFQHFSDAPVTVCPECNGAVRRVIHPVGIIFKGSGFYITDHKGNTAALMPKDKDTKKETPSSKESPEPSTPTTNTETKST